MSPLLDIKGLSVSFRTPRGELKALRDVSLSVGRSEIVGIIGESGCGKSTLINAVIGLLPANVGAVSGHIGFDGQELVGLPASGMRKLRGARITTIFQDPMTALNPVLTIGAQMTAIQYRRQASTSEKRGRAIEFLEKVRMPDATRRLDQYPHQFSGGMRQRICIAMALLTDPDLLIADEPTTALDATLEVQVIRLLKELQSDIGCSVLFISHHLGAVAELCERVAIMYAGEVVEEGAVRDIFRDPRHPYTRKLLDCDPGRIAETQDILPTIAGELPDLVHIPQGCIFRDRCPDQFALCGERPPNATVRPGHQAACHKARELAAT
ncbi:ABC transporter ATP-binding protein [Nordella sp. HKS 07]|uniref:ABC transporter ATP-binding protein n=1 Tax=Nordella sp. HKS 07 TaxID=2712222 RepID=UPI0013E0F10D|nr:ABC transporter ATP-binding protein [Nordella sp. HKS 07]QIG48484.1 ABC transporter ATP-binding protein [Nordella sp. HKS 07]